MKPSKPLTHLQDGSTPAWTVDWAYPNKQTLIPIAERGPVSEKSYYLYFKTEADAREFADWYLDGEEHRIYPGSVKTV
jgi:hypothetical protein